MLPPNFEFISNAKPFAGRHKSKVIASEMMINTISPLSRKPIYLQVTVLFVAYTGQALYERILKCIDCLLSQLRPMREVNFLFLKRDISYRILS